jgi:hypothetical protein
MQNYSDSNQTSQDSGDKPYIDLEVNDKYIIREFSENINPIELMWHRDDEDRTIEIIGDTNWSIQLDNQLPSSLNERIFIPRHMWHRVIKGTNNLNTQNTSRLIHSQSIQVKFFGSCGPNNLISQNTFRIFRG